MTVREQILASPETLSDFAWAAEQRFREAEELLFVGRSGGAVYLLGLSAEMWLKLACFRLLGAVPATVVASRLGPARAWMRAMAPTIDPESYHSLAFWAEYLIRWRVANSIALPAALTGSL